MPQLNQTVYKLHKNKQLMNSDAHMRLLCTCTTHVRFKIPFDPLVGVKLKYKYNHTCSILIFVCTLWNSSIILQLFSAFDKLTSLSLALILFNHIEGRHRCHSLFFWHCYIQRHFQNYKSNRNGFELVYHEIMIIMP